jgi:helix-turn-helix protein
MRAHGERESDPALACLRKLAAVSEELHTSASGFTASRARAPYRTEDLPYREMLPLRRRLEVIRQISTALRELNRHGQHFRRVEARALYEEGLTMAQLATVFGVSRQRVSALLREPQDPPGETLDAAGPDSA